MNRTFNEITTKPTYRGYPIQVDPAEGESCYDLLLDETIDRLHAFTKYTTKVYVLRFDLRFSVGFNKDAKSISSSSEFVSEFFRRLRTYLKKRTVKKEGMPYRNHNHIAFHWVREIDTAKNCHFHCWIAVDGHRIQRPGLVSDGSGLMGVMDRIWSAVCNQQGSLFQVYGKDIPVMLHVDVKTRKFKDPELLANTVYALSYLAKTRTKFSIKTGAFERIYGGSRYS
jgi:hypothetical protein